MAKDTATFFTAVAGCEWSLLRFEATKQCLNLLQTIRLGVVGCGTKGRKHWVFSLVVQISGPQHLLQYWAGVRIIA